MRNQVDRLADIRAAIRSLRAEAKAIQAQILAGEVALDGAEHVAMVRRQVVIRSIVATAAPTNGNGAQHPLVHPMWGAE